MIIAMGSIEIPFQPGYQIHGSVANATLSDPFLALRDRSRPSAILNKFIGDDLIIPQDGFHLLKVFDYMGGYLYEYTLFKTKMINDQPGYIPISIKRYGDNLHTYIYVNGVTLALDITRGSRDYRIISATELLKMFDANVVTYLDKILSIDSPTEIENILSELGTYALMDTTVSGYTIQQMFIDIITHDPYQLFLFDNKLPTDNLSPFEYCKSFITDDWLIRNMDASAHMYQTIAEDQNLQFRNMNLEYLDLTKAIFHNFQIDHIITELYRLPYTDLYFDIEDTRIKDVKLWKLGAQQPTHEFNLYIPRYLHDGIIYNNQRDMHQITRLTFSKTWKDDVTLSLVFQDGTVRNLYLNLGLYHLYSPSIIRIHPI